jgi:hypothetical protein
MIDATKRAVRTNSQGFLLMEKDDVIRVLEAIIRNREVEGSKQCRDLLPTEITHKTLKAMREQACLKGNESLIECGKWTQDVSDYIPSENFFMPPKRPLPRTPDYVCNKCKHPKLKNNDFIEKLFLHEITEKISDRHLRRYINDNKKISFDIFATAICNGYISDWITKSETIWAYNAARKYKVVLLAFKAIFQRHEDRRKESKLNNPEELLNQIIKEVSRQEKILENYITDLIYKKIEKNKSDPDSIEFFEKILYEIRKFTN